MIDHQVFGTLPSGKTVMLHTLKNSKGTTVSVIDYGAIITKIITPDKNGRFADIVLGYDRLEPYLSNPHYFGAVIGRVANRIANAAFPFNGKTVRLTQNFPGYHLHGGKRGFDKHLWKSQTFEKEGNPCIRFSMFSPDGEEGYPGNLKVTVTCSLTEDNRLIIDYRAETDKETVVNLTNHSYFNLRGEGTGNIYAHLLTVNAGKYTPLTKKTLVPTGRIASVEQTPYDFRKAKPLGKEIDVIAPGYDINFVLNTRGDVNLCAGRAEDPQTGRVLELFTTQPGIQLYTANYLENVSGKNGHVYRQHDAFCLETQAFPDAPNRPEFPSIKIKSGDTYRHRTIFKFGLNQ